MRMRLLCLGGQRKLLDLLVRFRIESDLSVAETAKVALSAAKASAVMAAFGLNMRSAARLP